MGTPKYIKNNTEWWDYTQCERPYKIQWTPKCGGWVRAKLDSITPWEYKRCGNSSNAYAIGDKIIEAQIERLERDL